MSISPSMLTPREIDRLLANGRVGEAVAGCQELLRQQPGNVAGLLLLSRALSRQGLHRQARQAVLAAWETQPSDPASLFEVGRRLRYFNEYPAVSACYGSPSFRANAPAQALTEAALSLSSIGENQAALDALNQALRRSSQYAPAYYMRGNINAFCGDFDHAEVDYERSLALDPRLFQAAWMLSGLRTQSQSSNHLTRLRQQLPQATPGRMGEVYLEFALYKELQDLQRYEEAWRHLESGCRKKRALLNYRPEDARRIFALLERVCSPRFVADAAEPVVHPTPIFIVGMHRSGTTLIERMLAGHSQVQDAGETYAFAEEMKLATNQAAGLVLDAPLVEAAAAADFQQVALGYAKRAAWLARGKPFFTEKLPTNFLHLGFIAKALPSAKILHLARNPMDTCFSNLRTLFSEAAPYSYDQTELADYCVGAHRLMRWWQEVLGDRMLVVDYQQLVTDFPRQAERIARFCGLKLEPAMLDVGRQAGAVTTASAIQLRDGLRNDRGAAWKPYAPWLRPLSDALAAADLLSD